MLVDRAFGADHTTMFTVDYEIGGAAQQHDHPFEEAYVFLAGEVEAELDGRYIPPGDWAFAPVGSAWLLQHRHRTGPMARDAARRSRRRATRTAGPPAGRSTPTDQAAFPRRDDRKVRR